MKNPRDHAQVLLRKAANDLTAADATLSRKQALDTVCFHAQQAVEKSLKAVLALHNVEYPWRHDLGELLQLAQPLAPHIQPFSDEIFRMTPYAVAVRYDDEFEPSLSEAAHAFEIAARIYELVVSIVEPDD
jgi:HEPN domain-containing protein